MDLKILFVCTGNTCRSPMAEGLAREIFGEEIQVGSAGMAAWEGQEASAHALEVLKEQNLDLSGHRSRRISAELLRDIDWIIPMTKAQEEGIRRLFPEVAHKTRCLGHWGKNKREVCDPWGGSLETYRQTAQEIGELLRNLKDFLEQVEA